MTFREEICRIINRCSKENESATPDLILAGYLEDCLYAFDRAVVSRTNMPVPMTQNDIDQMRRELDDAIGEIQSLRFGSDEAIRDLSNRLEKTEQERDEAYRMIRNLGARIDRDGGHKQQGESIIATVARLDVKVASLHSQLHEHQCIRPASTDRAD